MICLIHLVQISPVLTVMSGLANPGIFSTLTISPTFDIYQLNVNKSSDVCNSLLNDSNLAQHAFFVLTEPWAKVKDKNPHPIPLIHNYRQPFYLSHIRASKVQQVNFFRSMIWGLKSIPTRQIFINYSDIAAIVCQLNPTKRCIFLASVYIPCGGKNQ